LLLLAAVIAVSGCGGGGSAAGALPGGDGGGGGGSALEQQAFDLINDQRVLNGLPPLVWADDVAAVARAHSQDMVDRGFFDHINPDGLDPGQRLAAAGIANLGWAENIAKIFNTGDPADRAATGWMSSAGHRANILNPAYDESGMGVVLGGDGYWYFTQVFINRP
jgi:uncharacterized protein YkwD